MFKIQDFCYRISMSSTFIKILMVSWFCWWWIQLAWQSSSFLFLPIWRKLQLLAHWDLSTVLRFELGEIFFFLIFSYVLRGQCLYSESYSSSIEGLLITYLRLVSHCYRFFLVFKPTNQQSLCSVYLFSVINSLISLFLFLLFV